MINKWNRFPVRLPVCIHYRVCSLKKIVKYHLTKAHFVNSVINYWNQFYLFFFDKIGDVYVLVINFSGGTEKEINKPTD